VKLAIGAGRGGGISGISTTGAGFRSRTIVGDTFRVLAGIGPAGFTRRAFALAVLRGFAFAAWPALPPDFCAARDFAMDAYATGAGPRRQHRTPLAAAP